MKLKKDDILICKREFTNIPGTRLLTVNQSYRVTSISKHGDIWIKANTIELPLTYDEKRYCIWDYFYTDQELRKLKLEKLNEH